MSARQTSATAWPRWPVVLLGDVACAALALLASWRMRQVFDGFTLSRAISTLPLLVAGQLAALAMLGAARPHRLWAARLTAGVAAGSMAVALVLWWREGYVALPRLVLATDIWLTLLLTLAWRSSFTVLRPFLSAASSLQVAPASGLEERGAAETHRLGLTTVWQYRELLRNLVAKDLKLKYRGSVLGFLWSLIGPLATTAVYTVAFVYILHNRQPGYVFYLLLGILAWVYFAGSVSMSTGAIVDSGSLVKSVYFPRAILPLATVFFNLSQYLLTIIVFLPMMMAYYHVAPAWPMLAFPVFVILQTMFTAGLAFALAAGTTMYRDIRHFLDIALQALFWTTPIVYDAAMAPEPLGLVLRLSPLAPFVTAYHVIFCNGAWPDASVWMVAGLYAVTAFLIGGGIFLRLEDRFTEHV